MKLMTLSLCLLLATSASGCQNKTAPDGTAVGIVEKVETSGEFIYTVRIFHADPPLPEEALFATPGKVDGTIGRVDRVKTPRWEVSTVGMAKGHIVGLTYYNWDGKMVIDERFIVWDDLLPTKNAEDLSSAKNELVSRLQGDPTTWDVVFVKAPSRPDIVFEAVKGKDASFWPLINKGFPRLDRDAFLSLGRR